MHDGAISFLGVAEGAQVCNESCKKLEKSMIMFKKECSAYLPCLCEQRSVCCTKSHFNEHISECYTKSHFSGKCLHVVLNHFLTENV
jgi:hypothetical protein